MGFIMYLISYSLSISIHRYKSLNFTLSAIIEYMLEPIYFSRICPYIKRGKRI